MLRACAPLLAALIASAAAALDVPPPGARVTDQAGLLAPATVNALEQTLASFERETGHQLAVLVIPTLAGDPLEDFSLRVAEQWKLGSAGRDDGLLLLIAVAERRARIEVGHGLEGAVTDALSARVLRDTLGPALAAGVPDKGVRDALAILMHAAAGENPAGRPEPQASRLPVALFALCWLGLVFLMISLEQRRSRGLRGHDRWDRSMRRGGGVWIEPAGWGGGFGGGLGGGDGGMRGGGGSFGGGGASGSW